MLHKTLKKFAVALTIALPLASHAYPDKPLTMIIPFASGSATDVAGRSFAEVLSQSLNKPVAVSNKTGAEGQIALREVLSGPNDGHTLLFTSSSVPVLDPLMKTSLTYDPVKELTPICTVGNITFLMNITGSSPMKTVGEVIAAAKAAPGQISFAYSSASMRLAGELFQQAAGIKLNAVPYRSSAAALTEVSGGLVDLVFIDSTSAGAFYQSGKLRPLIVSGEKRLKELPEVSTSVENGLADFKVMPWFGVYVSAKTPPPIVEQVRKAVTESMNRPDMQSAIEKRNLNFLLICGENMKKFQDDEIALWRRVIKNAGIQPQ